MKKAKIFVLDTNVILHDHKSIKKFQDNDIVVPIAVVEELDKFKKGNDALSYNARGFMRDINKLTANQSFGPHGVRIAKGLGRIKIEPNRPFPKEFANMFRDDIQDHRILSTAMWVRDHNPDYFVALVTKDINLRLKAKAVDMAVQDYLTDQIEEEKLENSFKEVQDIEVQAHLYQELAYGQAGSLDWKEICAAAPRANQLFKLRLAGSSETLLARHTSGKIALVRSKTAYNIRPRNEEQSFALDALLNPKIQLVSLTGGAGTGKTLLALAAALEQEREYEQIILSRPTVILGNQDLGFLPGDQKAKMGPFLQPLMDNLNVIKSQFAPTSRQAQKIEAMLKSEKLLIEPLAYIRGRSLGKSYFIIDEAQNLTPHEMKTIITRAGEGTKMVFTGDIFQIDQPYLDQWSNGLSHLGEKMSGQEIFQHVFLRKGERSKLSELASKLL